MYVTKSYRVIHGDKYVTLTEVVEVEGVLPGDGAVEAGLEVGGPPGAELVGPALVVLAHPPHTAVHALKYQTDRKGSEIPDSRNSSEMSDSCNSSEIPDRWKLL